jgi:hypothetical protein
VEGLAFLGGGWEGEAGSLQNESGADVVAVLWCLQGQVAHRLLLLVGSPGSLSYRNHSWAHACCS